MSYLQKTQSENRKEFERVKLFLQAKQIDLDNLPSIQSKKPIEVAHEQQH